MKGAPPKPMSGTRSASSRRSSLIVSSTSPSASRGSNVRRRSTSAAVRIGLRDRRPFALDEVEVEPHRRERNQQIGKQDRGIHVDDVYRLQRDRHRELGRAADIEQRVALPQRAIIGHVAPGLAHEPDGRRVDRLAPAGFQESIVHAETRVLASAIEIFEPERFESDGRAERFQLVLDGFREEVIAGHDRDRHIDQVRTSIAPAGETADRW